jgi:hypothetical protein
MSKSLSLAGVLDDKPLTIKSQRTSHAEEHCHWQKPVTNSCERETSRSEWEGSACTHEQSNSFLFEGWREREVIL